MYLLGFYGGYDLIICENFSVIETNAVHGVC